jgi:hypothetical protein
MRYRLRPPLIVLAVAVTLFLAYAVWYGRNDAIAWLQKYVLP